MDNKNSKFIDILKTTITGGNRIVDKFFDISIIDKNGLPDIALTISDDRDELHVLMLQCEFIASISEDTEKLISKLCKTKESAEYFKEIFYKTLYTLTNSIQEKLKLLKEN